MPDGSSGCIAADMGKRNATCCNDDSLTGCPVGYQCRPSRSGSKQKEGDCLVSIGSRLSDPLTRVLPRYRLCNAKEIDTVHGLPVEMKNSSANDDTVAEIAYYSNIGPIEKISSSVDMALIVVHGATRNADDYFCSAKATVELQTRFSRVLILAPNFYSAADDRPKKSFLYWDSQDQDGTWRYGADSAGPVQFSSFSVLDQLVTILHKKFPDLKLLTIAGHSSGGQVVQRWSLLSSVWRWQDPVLQAVVANPSNYAYLTPLRFIDGEWRHPGNDFDARCNHYNQWEWGLDGGGEIDVPYRNRALINITAVVDRYKERKVSYLAGGIDRCNVSEGDSGWCNSHGLETKCMDNLQGLNRLERNSRFIASLRSLGFWSGNHKRILVPGIGHDHALMFQSPEGISAIYYGQVWNTKHKQ